MKTANFFFTTLMIILCFSCKQEKEGLTEGNLYISNATPAADETINIKYTPEANQENLNAYYYYMVGSRVYAEDINLIKEQDFYKGSIHIPDSATTIAINFENNRKYDSNNKKGYIFPLRDKNGDLLNGANASIGFYQQEFGGFFGVEVDKAVSVGLIKNDLLKNPTLQEEWDAFFPVHFISQNKEDGKKYIEKRIAYYIDKNDLNESQFTNLATLYTLNGQNEKHDSLKNLETIKYPSGMAAEKMAAEKIFYETNFDTKKQLFADYETTFGKNAQFRDNLLEVMAKSAIQNDNKEEFFSYINKVSDKEAIVRVYNDAAALYATQEKNLSFAEETNKLALEKISSLLENPKSNNRSIPTYQFKSQLEYRQKRCLATYALIQFKLGNIDEAIRQQKELVGEGLAAVFNENYLQYLMAAKKYEEVLSETNKYVNNNAYTPKIIAYYKTAYVAKNGSEEGLETKLEEFEQIKDKKLIAKIKASMIDKAAKDFTLKNTEGKEVNSASLKGKTVILDFWATWCGPCKASFPGMQMAINKYKEDENVVFLFVNTMENGTFEAKSKTINEYLNNNNYTFEVLVDEPTAEGSKEFLVASNFGVTGLPTKIIIGPDGNIKFTVVGNSSDLEELVKELSIKIDLLNS